MAMDRNELLRRIEKKQKDIEKINKRIIKWSTGLRPQDIEVVKPFGEIDYIYGTPKYKQQYELYKQYKDNPDIPKNKDWTKGPDFYELYSAYRDLGDNKATLQKYQVALDKIDNFEREEKIEVIWKFLTEWENMAYNWYLVNAEKYFNLKKNYSEEWQEYKKENLDKYIDWQGRPDAYRCQLAFERKYFIEIDKLTMDLTTIKKEYVDENDITNHKMKYVSYKVDEPRLAKILKDEKQRKYEDLVNRVTQVTGIITDASNLKIDAKGNLNGIIIGDKGKAKLETIGAGGYNIMIFHWRTLIHPIK